MIHLAFTPRSFLSSSRTLSRAALYIYINGPFRIESNGILPRVTYLVNSNRTREMLHTRNLIRIRWSESRLETEVERISGRGSDMRRTYLISCNARVKSWSLKVESKLEREGKLDGSRLQSSHFITLAQGSRVRESKGFWVEKEKTVARIFQCLRNQSSNNNPSGFTFVRGIVYTRRIPRAVFHAYSFVDYTRGSRKEIRGKPLLLCAISCAKSRTK